MKILKIILILTYFANHVFSQSNNIPDYLLNKEYYNNPQFAIGISDPIPDSTLAFEQAMNRALLNYGLFHKGKYASLCSVASANSQQNNSKLNNIETILFSSIFSASFAINDSFEIVQKNYSNYGECFVLLHKTKLLKSKADTFKFSLVRQIAFYNDEAGIPVSTDELEIKTLINNQALHYKTERDIQSKYHIVSELGHKTQRKTFEVKNKYRNYSNNNSVEAEIYKCSENLNYGFWAAYIYALSDQMSIYSALNQNITQRLVSIRQGNLQEHTIESELELLYNTKKIETKNRKLRINNPEISANKLIIQLVETKSMQDVKYSIPILKRKERNKLKHMQKENWQELTFKNYKDAFYVQKYYQNKENYIHSQASTKSGNVALGIMQGILVARLDMESQLKSKIMSISKLEISANKNSAVKNAKSMSDVHTNNIFPYLFFIKKINRNAYLINTNLFYKLNSANLPLND